MENLIELVAFIGSGILGVFLFRFLKPNVKKQNTEVVIKVDKIEKANQELQNKIQDNKSNAEKQSDIMEEEKKKDLSAKGLADFFNNRGN